MKTNRTPALNTKFAWSSAALLWSVFYSIFILYSLFPSQSSRVLSFTPAPNGEDGFSDLLTIVKRFGAPLYTLDLPSLVSTASHLRLSLSHLSTTAKLSSSWGPPKSPCLGVRVFLKFKDLGWGLQHSTFLDLDPLIVNLCNGLWNWFALVLLHHACKEWCHEKEITFCKEKL